jgi:hypothetical protein
MCSRHVPKRRQRLIVPRPTQSGEKRNHRRGVHRASASAFLGCPREQDARCLDAGPVAVARRVRILPTERGRLVGGGVLPYRVEARLRMLERLLVVVSGALVALVVVASVDATPKNTKFVSKLYGYSIVLPGASSRWLEDPAIATWTSGAIEPHLSAVDTITDQKKKRFYLVAARRPPTGATLQKWTKFIVATEGCATVGSFSTSKLDGAAARVLAFSCSEGYTAAAVTALHAQRGYVLIVASTSSVAANRQALDSARRSFHYTPAG